MIIIPEIETVVILVPRTGSGTLKRAIPARYPKSMRIYRHMEADGVPHGYDRWRKVGILRHPVERLWSLYKFCHQLDPHTAIHPEHVARLLRSVQRPFDEWLCDNMHPFTNAYSDGEKFYPEFSVNHSMAENRKSQFLYLRPDLGTEIWPFECFDDFCRMLDVTPGHENRTDGGLLPHLSARAEAHVRKFFACDRLTHSALLQSFQVAA